MGNTTSVPWARSVDASDASTIFHALDVHDNAYLTLKDLMEAPSAGLLMPHSLPALYFFDAAKNGRLTEPEFASLVHFCQSEKRKVEDALSHDKSFRDLIHRASKAGVKDCSVHGRSSYRRLSSYTNVRSVFSTRNQNVPSNSAGPAFSFDENSVTSASTQPDMTHFASTDGEPSSSTPSLHPSIDGTAPIVEQSVESDASAPAPFTSVAMYSSQREFNNNEKDAPVSDADMQNPQNRTALDAAVFENVMHANIHKLADMLHTEGSREKFMAWLWELADYKSSGVVTLEELRVFLAALSEDGIDLEELAFYRQGGESLEVCIINEFDTTHAGLLSRDEFMVLADLVTREYEFWENRHLDRIGDYELGRTIGRGSSGVVRLAMHVESRQKFAVKIIKKGKCSDLSRLDREIQCLMASKHKHIVALEEVLDSETNIFIVMELCGGGSMVDIVRLYSEERMPEDTARFFVRQVFEALAFLHSRSICHRDVRLDNLMLDNAGIVKVTDFGHSGMYTPGWDLFSTPLVGSVYNLSPEQISGRVYSGEKIDVWSAGVAVYCLLVGRPPFHDPDVNLLLDRIIRCEFEIPSFVSAKASELMSCMIRAAPDERIPIAQMLHHPWFYEGPEHGPSMDVVVFPVDSFFRKRPDIAEMILAITIYQHRLHFHLATTHNAQSFPEEHRGQDWSLRCLCPKNDIKFVVSLFTRKPHLIKPSAPQRRIQSSAEHVSLAQRSSDSLALDSHVVGGIGGSLPGRTPVAVRAAAMSSTDLRTIAIPEILPRDDAGSAQQHNRTSIGTSGAKPPLQRRLNRVTPHDIAQHLRVSDAMASNAPKDPFDFEPEPHKNGLAMHSFQEDWLLHMPECSGFGGCGSETSPEGLRPRNGSRWPAPSSREGSVHRINRSATMDAFPYGKLYPPRKMPDSALNLTFNRPEGGGAEDPAEVGGERSSADWGTLSTPMTPTFGKADGMNSSTNSFRSPLSSAPWENEIAQKLVRHPSKAMSPQSPQLRRLSTEAGEKSEGMHPSDGATVRPPGGSTTPSVVTEPVLSSTMCVATDEKTAESPGSVEVGDDGANSASEDEIEPFIEVRLQTGESGLFLKICHKLKRICTTKLSDAAERQKKRTGGRRSLSTLRRTASAKSISSEMPSPAPSSVGSEGEGELRSQQDVSHSTAPQT